MSVLAINIATRPTTEHPATVGGLMENPEKIMSNPNFNPFAGQSKTHKCVLKKHTTLVAKRYHVISRQGIFNAQLPSHAQTLNARTPRKSSLYSILIN
jgi:hypothetical protein